MASVIKLKYLVDALVLCCGESPDASLDRCISDIERFSGDVENSQPLKRALESPVIAVEEKIAVLDDLCRVRGFSGIFRNFLVMAAELGKLKSLQARRHAIVEKLRSLSGATRSVVTVAHPLSEDDREQIREVVARLCGGGNRSEVEFIEDSEIIGGIVVRIGNDIYDDSVGTHLKRMRAALSK